MNNLKKVLKQINEITSEFGIPKSKRTIYNIKNINEYEKQIELKKGNFTKNEISFGIYENKNLKITMDSKLFLKLLSRYKDIQRENFSLILEKLIFQEMPIDYADVQAVVIKEISAKFENNSGITEIELEKIVKNVKIKYPNLFLNLNNFEFLNSMENES